MINSYFDFSDYTIRDINSTTAKEGDNKIGVIKQYIDDRFFFELIMSRAKSANIFLQKSQAFIQDDYIQLYDPTEMNFIEV